MCVMRDAAVKANVAGQITLLVRGNYSNPPNHGARIVLRVLSDPVKYQKWTECIKTMAGRIQEMRVGLRQRLGSERNGGNLEPCHGPDRDVLLHGAHAYVV